MPDIAAIRWTPQEGWPIILGFRTTKDLISLLKIWLPYFIAGLLVLELRINHLCNVKVLR